MSINDPTKRILTEFGEPEEFFGFTFGDLKLLIPALFLGMFIVGNTPETFRLVGWGIAGGLVLTMLILIYASPGHQTTENWLKSRLHYLRQPSVVALSPAHGRGEIDNVDELSPEVEDQRNMPDGGAAAIIGDHLPDSSRTTSTQELTNVERFHVAHRAGKRDDGYVFGAVQVHPANMALATHADWEHAVERLGSIVNGIEFPFQIYSTVTPVDPERITKGYRDRLGDRTTDLNSDFQALLQTYQEKLPREFARRGTSIREFYIIVPVSVLDVQRDVNAVNDAGILATLENLSYVGGFVTTFRASRRDVSPEELEAKQLAELDHRLTTIEEEIAGLDGCSTTRISTSDIAALLKDFWEPATRTDDDPAPTVRETPVVYRETDVAQGTTQSADGGDS